jgi:hypothetical protein
MNKLLPNNMNELKTLQMITQTKTTSSTIKRYLMTLAAVIIFSTLFSTQEAYAAFDQSLTGPSVCYQGKVENFSYTYNPPYNSRYSYRARLTLSSGGVFWPSGTTYLDVNPGTTNFQVKWTNTTFGVITAVMRADYPNGPYEESIYKQMSVVAPTESIQLNAEANIIKPNTTYPVKAVKTTTY